MYAIIASGGKQYKVSVGDVLFLEKVAGEAEGNVEFGEVLAIDGTIGAPTVSGAKVLGKVLKQGKGKKITVFTYRAKKGSARKLGHRQPFTKVEITGIEEPKGKKEKNDGKEE